MKGLNLLNRVRLGALLTAVSGLALADAPTFDTTTVVAAIAAAATAIGVVGAAVFSGPIIVAKAWKWMRSGA